MGHAIEVTHQSNGARLVSVEGRQLPLRNVVVSGQAKGGLARVVLKQTFANPHAEPMKVTYTMPLPADGAVAGYEFRVGTRRVVGEIDRRASARERFEQALVDGRTAGILDQERANLFTQEIGNVPPRTEVAVELTIDQPLTWLPEGMWEWRFPTVAAPRYLGAAGRVPDAPNVTVDVADVPTGVRASLEFAIGDALADGRRPESPSHGLSIGSGATTRVTLSGDNGAALDRDFVVRWPVPRPRPGVTLQTARPDANRPHAGHAYGLLTIVPPETPAAVYPRDLIVLLDTSGSMSGPPLDQARRVVAALLDSLADNDRLEMISFADRPRHWRNGPVAATAETRRDAHRWLAALHAGGGTEMLHAVEEALKPLRPDAQRQVVLVTDGDIGFESQLLHAIQHDLPTGSRLHAVGVGSAPNRALTRPAARAGRGVEVLAALDEDAERAAARLIAATRGPAIVDLEIHGPAVAGSAPHSLPDLMAGAPVLVGLSLRPDGGELIVRGRTPDGHWEERLAVPPTETGAGSPGVTALYGREAVEDLDLDLAAGADRGEIDRATETLGLEFGIATRLTSWVAISEEPTVDPRLPVRREIIPQELPYGMSAEGLGLMQHPAYMVSAMADLRVAQEYDLVSECRSMAASTSSLRFTGRWVPGASAEIQVLTFEASLAGLEWHPDSFVQLILRSGKWIFAEVVETSTTIAGRIGPGDIVKLALKLGPHDPKDVLAVEVDWSGTRLRIDPQ
jgi:Ca-activated chloride channel family protein